MKIEFITHQDIKKKDLAQVVDIKAKVWPYSIDKQYEWIADNINKRDIHVLLREEEGLILAYLNLIEIFLNINNQKYNGFGIGNVCSVIQGMGYGKKLITTVNEYLLKQNKIGLLFCKDKVLDFYQKLDWKLVGADRINIANINTLFTHVMIFNFQNEINELIYDGKLF